MIKEDIQAILAIGAIFAIIVGCIGLIITQPYFEARAFNKLTNGPKASYWDAMWTKLRVVSQ